MIVWPQYPMTKETAMKLMPLHNRKDFICRQHEDEIHTTIVSKLLATIIAVEKGKIIVEGGSQHFAYDANTAFSVGKHLRLCIHDVQIETTKSSLELNLRGRVKTSQGRQQTCSIYLFLWWDHTQPSPIRRNITKNLQLISLLIQPARATDRLSDVVFEFDLFRKQDNRPLLQFGQLRGYLVLGPVT